MRHIFLYIFLVLGTLYAKEQISSALTDKNHYKIYKDHEGKVDIKKGDYLIMSLFSNQGEENWAKNFNIVEMGGVDDNHVTPKLLQKKGVLGIKRRLGYDWMPAFYYYTSGKNRDFVDWIYKNRKKATLNPNGPFLHCKKHHYDWCKDYYYNYGYKILFDKRVDDLIADIKLRGFNGVFFDWASGGFILEDDYKGMKEYFQKLNPQKNYFELIGDFYKTLKKRGVFVVTNQAFRKEKYLLKYTTYDMTESYITTDVYKKMRIQIEGKGWLDGIKVTNYYPIYKNSKTIKDSLHFIDVLTNFKNKYKKYGLKNFIYMNYIAPRYEKVYETFPLYKEVKPKNAIYFSYAMAKLTDNLVYAEIPNNRELERDRIYFYDLGKPLGKSYKRLKDKDIYVRFYTKGFVVASEAYKKDIYLNIKSPYIPSKHFIFDAFNSCWLKSKDNEVTIKLSYQKDSFSKRYLPLGRVYLYETKP